MTLGIGRHRRIRSRPKTTACPYCGSLLSVAREAVSVSCGRCNNRVELEDLEVFENITRDLMTGASVLVRKEATVNGSIHAAEIIVFGVVQGNLKASLKIRLEGTATVIGSIEAPSIDMENGATVLGTLEIQPKPERKGRRDSES